MEGFLQIMIAVARLGHARSLEAFIYLEYGRRERMNTIKKQGLTQFHTGRSVERPDCRQLRSCQWQSVVGQQKQRHFVWPYIAATLREVNAQTSSKKEKYLN